MATRPYTQEPIPVLEERPPIRRVPPRRWVRENLFNSTLNSVMTVVFGVALALGIWRALRFLFVTARWEIVRVNLTNYMVGTFSREDIWRVWAAVYLLVVLVGVRWGIGVARRAAAGERSSVHAPLQRIWPLAMFGVVVMIFSGSFVTILLLAGLAAVAIMAREAGRTLPPRAARWYPLVFLGGIIVAFEVIVGFGGVGYDRWSGLLLTMFLAIGGIVLSFPLGVLLALGRRSSFPAIRVVSVAYIELIRGVPLITLLFMGFLVLGFFLPPGTSTPSLVTRALVAMILFTAAYVAEIVRGGLQAVPRGQIEAAQAVGLSPVKVTGLIVLPQALRAVIPAMVGQFISLFKDTSLAGFIGLFELLEIARNITSQPRFLGQGLAAETLVFASFIYWVGAYWMSKTSQRLERRLGVGER